MPVFHVTVPEFMAVLNGLPNKGAKIVTMRTDTEPKLLVKHRVTKEPIPYADGLRRLVYRTVTLAANYGNAVERQREKEGVADPDAPFVPEQLWKGAGVRVDNFTVTHKVNGGLYFTFKPAQHESNENLCGTVLDLHEVRWINCTTGMELTAAEVRELEHYLPPIGKSRAQGVDHDVAWRTVKLENVVAIHGITKGGVYYLLHK